MQQTGMGIMSGTSLDGLDLAICQFSFNKKWNFKILDAKTIPYSDNWKQKLSTADKLSGIDLINLHKEYGKLIGNTANDFIQSFAHKIDFIASHGHTVFHQPDKGLNLQIGDGNVISAITGITTISDFRSMDIALGGQGAPLVPIGDRLLFSEYDFCLNLGGFANISFESENKRIAYDICPVNIIVNELASKTGVAFDKDGEIGKSGYVHYELLDKLNNIEFYHKRYPKSLGKEWLTSIFSPFLEDFNIPLNDKIRTLYEHISHQITNSITSGNAKVLITGGGAHNVFLIDLLKQKTKANIVIPTKEIIDFKEAIVFAFLGLRRLRGEINCLASVTGAKIDSCGGSMHQL